MLSGDIITRISAWLADAKAEGSLLEPTAMNLATVDSTGQPHSRMVLLKDFAADGFTFYTNLGSPKSHDLEANAKAALCFHWMPLRRQLRIEGIAHKVSDAEADAYFASRPRESQLGAHASHQSQPLKSRAALEEAYAQCQARFEGKQVPRPDFWSGFRVDATLVEFWQHGESRLHDRDCYRLEGNNWTLTKLYP